MTQIVLNIEDKSLLPGLRKILSSLNGVSIAKTRTTRKNLSGIEKGLEDIRNGNIYRAKDSADLIKQI